MKRKYRIKTGVYVSPCNCITAKFAVQVRSRLGLWITVKSFHDCNDVGFAKREAVELYEYLKEG